MTKVVLKLQLYQDKHKKKAMKIASGIEGLNSISMDTDMKLSVTGDVDPVELTKKLRKLCDAQILSVSPEEEKKNEDTMMLVYQPPPPPYYYQQHYPMQGYYYTTSQEEYPNGCVIWS